MPSRQEVFLGGGKAEYPSLVGNKAATANEGGGLLGEEYFNNTQFLSTNGKLQLVSWKFRVSFLIRVMKTKIKDQHM